MKNIEELLVELVKDAETVFFKLPPDIDTVRWIAGHVLHWVEENTAPRIEETERLKDRILKIARRSEGLEKEDAEDIRVCGRYLQEELDALRASLAFEKAASGE